MNFKVLHIFYKLLCKPRRFKKLFVAVPLLWLCVYLWIQSNVIEEYPYIYEGDLNKSISLLRQGFAAEVPPLIHYNVDFIPDLFSKKFCEEGLVIIFLIKSKAINFYNRRAIRATWGLHAKIIFLIGKTDNEKIQEKLKLESQKFNDLVQGNFSDNDEVLKTLIGFDWAEKYCPSSEYYFILTDTYYVFYKNLMKLIEEEITKNNKVLYEGHVDDRWHLKESRWPKYIIEAYLLSNKAFFDMYFASFYIGQLKNIDAFIGLLAMKVYVSPKHNEHFYPYGKPYNFNKTIAANGFSRPEYMLGKNQE